MKKISTFRAERSDKRSVEQSRSVRLAASLSTVMIIASLLSACSSASTPTPIPTVILDSGNDNNIIPVSNRDSVTASAMVVSVQEAHLAFTLGGNIATVKATVGDRVNKGQVLVELNNTSAKLEVENAQRVLRELLSPASVAAAEQAAAQAQKTYDDAKKKLDSAKNRHADNVTIDYLKDQVTLAQHALDRARDAFKKTARRSALDPVRAKAATDVYNAQRAYNQALGNLNWYANPPSEVDVALVTADFDAAAADLQEAQWYLSELKGDSIPADATGAQLAQLQQARDNLQAAEDKLEQTRLTAPFPGVIATVDAIVGEYASPGQVLIVVSDTEHLRVKTTDLSERDITGVKVGNSVTITVDALNEQYDGEVVSISPMASLLGGDVVYEVTVAFTKQPEGPLSGMSAEVTIEE